MTVKKPAFIYSVIVETLKACRTPQSEYSLEDKVDTYTAAVIIDMCKDAVADNSDIKHFRGTCEWILETILRLRKDTYSDIHPMCRHRLVKEELMVKSDSLTVNNMNEKLSVG
tara:strand:+ start:3819 stop:4157 length:339 start_codon:yes stop_codon:yes gene_type:complete